MSGYAHLTADERDRLAGLKADGLSLRAIALVGHRSARPRNVRPTTGAFPVRVRVLVPTGGYGTLLDEIHAWLAHKIGRGDYAHHSGLTLFSDASAYYSGQSRT